MGAVGGLELTFNPDVAAYMVTRQVKSRHRLMLCLAVPKRLLQSNELVPKVIFGDVMFRNIIKK